MKLRPPSSFAPWDRPAWQSYGFAFLILVGALLLRWALAPYARTGAPLATMYLAVALAVWFGGWKPAALISIAGYVISLYLFAAPQFTFKLSGDLGPVRLFLYVSSCAVIIYLCESVRRARKRHAFSEARVVSILENMREAFCAVDPDWRITFVNRSAEKGLRQPRARLLGRSLWEALPSSAGSPMEAQLRLAMREGKAVEFETNTVVTGAWHAVTATRSGDELSIFFQDITATRAHVDQLERLVDDRTAALQRIVAELEAFSYTLVHDIRAPLRSITGFAELLAADHAAEMSPEGQHHLARIQSSAARMDQLIVDILAYSQLARSPQELRAVNLDETMRDILRSHTDFSAERAEVEIQGRLPTVNGNDVLLTQCFSNLLHNAIKFVGPGVRPRVRITSSEHAEIARVVIADNGIGIPREAMVRIFEPFRREHAHYDGTGIGLAIVQRVVDQLGGRVGVDSEVGKGSRFWVELKVRPVAVTPETAAPSRPAGVCAPAPQ
jgi:PAS domain S-box-containing protein